MVIPRADATASSLPSSHTQSRTTTSPVASARTANVAAWAPALPPLSMSSGRKNTSATTASMVCSK
jgi:hypothetical protein